MIETVVDGLQQPLWLLAALALTVAGLWRAAGRRPPTLDWPAWSEAEAAGASRRDWLRLLSLLARGSALLTLGVVLAEPVMRHRAPPPPGQGLDIVLVLDTSGSMRALDAQVEDQWRTRLDLAREAVERFALHRLSEGDRVGLVVFGETAFTQCPLTSDGRLLAAALQRVEPGMAGEATALGDALALAVKRVGGASAPPVDDPVEGRVVVLLTDGRSNAGAVPPEVARAIARARGVRVHTVGIGSVGEVAMAPKPDSTAGEGLHFERHDLDEETLVAIAESSGGRFYPARSTQDLEVVYGAIDALERVPRRPPARVRELPRPEPFLAVAGLLVILEIGAVRGLARRIP